MQYRISFRPWRSAGICSGGKIGLSSTSNGGCGKCGVVVVAGDSSFLLMTSGSLVRFSVFSVETFEGYSQINPSYFKGVPLGDQKFVFDVSLDAARNVAES